MRRDDGFVFMGVMAVVLAAETLVAEHVPNGRTPLTKGFGASPRLAVALQNTNAVLDGRAFCVAHFLIGQRNPFESLGFH